MNRSFERAHAQVLGKLTSEKWQGFDSPNEDVPKALRVVLRRSGLMGLYQLHDRLIDPGLHEPDEGGVVTFAEESQSIIRWGFRPEDGEDPPVYQQALGERAYGSWVKDAPAMSEFLLSFTYWNAANGGADISAVGEASESTRSKLGGLDVVWKGPDFEVHEADGAFLIVTEDLDYYAFGKDPKKVRDLSAVLEPAWVDYEPAVSVRRNPP